MRGGKSFSGYSLDIHLSVIDLAGAANSRPPKLIANGAMALARSRPARPARKIVLHGSSRQTQPTPSRRRGQSGARVWNRFDAVCQISSVRSVGSLKLSPREKVRKSEVRNLRSIVRARRP